MRSHERIEELIAIRSLGGLEAQDLEELEAEMHSHGRDCSECRRLESEFEEVAGRLAFALEPAPVGEDFRERTFELALGDRADPEPRGRRGRFVRPLVAVAAAFALFVGGWLIGGAVTGDGEVPAQATVVAFEGETGSLAAAYTPGERGVYLLGSDLAPSPEGRRYQFWMIQGETPTPGPCFSPSADGSLFEFVDAELGTTDTIAVTIEPETCSTAPTTEPIFVADLATA